MPDDLITSAANPLVKRIRLLTDRKHRRREGRFVVHGGQPVWQAVEAGAEIETLVIAPELLRDSPAGTLVAQQAARGVPVARLTAELFARICDRDGPSGIAAVVRTWPMAIQDLPVRPDTVLVALHEIGNPGNLGTIIRTADAAGAGGVILIGHTTDPYDPAAVKASMGALFQVPIGRVSTVEEFFDWSATATITVITTSARAEQDYWRARYQLPVAFLLGSEGRGLPEPVLARGATQVRIPIVGRAESLNLAVAAGLLLYEALRRH